MTFYIAEKQDDGKFVLWWHEGKVREYHSQKEALNSFKIAVGLHGTENVKLLQGVEVSITMDVKIHDPKAS